MSSDDATRGRDSLTRRDFLHAGGALGLAIGAGSLLAACGGGQANTATGGGAAAPAARGGVLRFGVSGAAASGTCDPQKWVDNPDLARIFQLYDAINYGPGVASYEHALADEVTPNADGTQWTIRLKDGVEFHNGKTLDADDLLFTVRRALDPKFASTAQQYWGWANPKRMKRLDARTVRFELDAPFALVNEFLITPLQGAIVPVGFDPARPVGTGPFKLTAFTPGRQTTFARFENYYGGAPLLDGLRMVEFADDASLANAFVGGQLDAVESVPSSSRAVVKGNAGLHLFVQRVNSTRLLAMRTDVAPFSDVRVRQAIRLLADRPQLVANAADGYGTVANDMYVSPQDPGYPSGLPQRVQDVEQAKSLLRAAGQSGLHTQISTTDAASGMVEMAQLLSEQAKAAGVTIDVKNIPTGTYYGKDYLTYPFAADYDSGGSFWRLSNYFEAPGAPYNSTHWHDPEWTKLYKQAVATLDAGRRNQLVQQMQRISYERGGHIIWGFVDQVGGISDKVRGMAPENGVTGPLNSFNFRRAGVA